MANLHVLQTGVVVADSAPRPRARTRGMAALRRHPFLAVTVLAVFVRVLVAIVSKVLFAGHVFGDERYYEAMATDIALNSRSAWRAFDEAFYDATGGFLWPLALVYRVFGAGSIAGQLLVVGFGVATVVLTMVVSRRVVAPRWVVLAGLLAALLPSTVLWSSLTLKDAQVWTLVGLATLAVASSIGARGWTMAAMLALAAGSLLTLAFVRPHSFVVGCLALLLAAWFGPREGRAARGLAGSAVAVVLPWLVGLGPLGSEMILHSGSLDFRRAANAEGARTAFVPSVTERSLEIRRALEAPDGQGRGGPSDAAGVPGVDRPLDPLEEPVIVLPSFDDSLADNLSHLPRGVVSVLLEPTPWRSGSANVRFGGVEALIWYPMLLLAGAGLVVAIRHRGVLAFPVLYAGGMIVLYALTEGNIGTSFRHRAEATWVVCILAAAGAQVLCERWTAARRTS